MTEGVKAFMRKMGYHKQVQMIESGNCPTCGEKITSSDFRTALDVKEHEISGNCQKCIDEYFKKEHLNEIHKGVL